ncbi:MAG: hypothetical protein ABSC65_06345 [Acidobacteriaceae bacterium]|jgi:hypothetical protein
MRPLRLLILSLLSLAPLSLHAQLGLYAGLTVQNPGIPGDNSYDLYGGTLGAYLASGHLAILSLGVDLRGSFTRSSGNSFNTGAIGPRLGLNLHIIPLHPYAEATVGIASLNLNGGSPNNGTSFEYQLLGGLDVTVLPRIDWRVAEFSYGGVSVPNGNSYHPKTLTTALVLRIPRFFPLP